MATLPTGAKQSFLRGQIVNLPDGKKGRFVEFGPKGIMAIVTYDGGPLIPMTVELFLKLNQGIIPTKGD